MKSALMLLALIVANVANGQATPVQLMCKNFRFSMAVGGSISYNGYSIQIQQTAVTTNSGETRLVYAPIMTTVEQQFQAIATPAGAKGENLLPGQCGLADGVLPGVSLDVRSGRPVLQFANFRNMTIINGGQFSGSTVTRGAVTIAPCASGITLFRAIPQNPNTFFVSGDSSVGCL